MANVDISSSIRNRVYRNIYQELHPGLYGGLLYRPMKKKVKDDRHVNEQYKEEKLKKKPKGPFNVENVCWFIASIAVFYYTDFAATVIYDLRVKRIWFNIGAILFCIFCSIAGFLIVWLTWIKKIKSDDWENLYPSAIPFATGTFIIGSICITVGLWPVWSFFTPLILFTLFMGLIVTIVMLPTW